MIAYRTVIAFKFPEPVTEIVTDDKGNEIENTRYVDKLKYLPIDYLSDRSINASSNIVTQPLQSGDTMADHMYRLPTTIDLSGKFSLNGRNWNNDTYTTLYNSTDRLTSIEWIFEYIKNSGRLCTITTVSSETNTADQISYDNQDNLFSNINPSSTRFITRENMALTGITWKEGVNTVEFSFKFTEVIMIDTEVYDIDPSDLLLPEDLAQPKMQSVGSILFETGQLPKAITETLYKKGYIKDDWLREVVNTIEAVGTYYAVLLAVGVGVGLIVLSAVVIHTMGLTAALSSMVAPIVPVGTIIAGAIIVATAIVAGIAYLITSHKKKEKEKRAFKLINGKPDQDYNRYCNLMDDIEAAINKAGSQITVYAITSDENQQICLPIGGNYYYISINSCPESPYFKSEITINSGGPDGDPISNKRQNWGPVSNFMDLNENVNLWFKDESKQYQVYLVNPNLNDIVNEDDGSKTVLRKKLSSYSIWISKGSIKEQIKNIQNAIDKAIVAHDFK